MAELKPSDQQRNKEDEAATKVQATFRGNQARESVKIQVEERERLTKILQDEQKTGRTKEGMPLSYRVRRLETFIAQDEELQGFGASDVLKESDESDEKRFQRLETFVLMDKGDRKKRLDRLETVLETLKEEDEDGEDISPRVDLQLQSELLSSGDAVTQKGNETEQERLKRVETQWPPDESKFGKPKPKDMPKVKNEEGEGEQFPVGNRYITNALVKVRKGEDSKSPTLITLQPKTYVEIIEKGKDKQRVKIRANDMDGWILLLNPSGNPLLDEVPEEQQSAMILDYNLGKLSRGLENIAGAIRADGGELPQMVYPNMKPREKPLSASFQVSANTLSLLERATSLSGEKNPSQHQVRNEGTGAFMQKHHSHTRLHNAMSQMAFLLAQRGRMRGEHVQEQAESRMLRTHAEDLQERLEFTKREALYWQKRAEHDSMDSASGYQGSASQGQSPYEVREATMALQGCIQQVQAIKGQLNNGSKAGNTT